MKIEENATDSNDEKQIIYTFFCGISFLITSILFIFERFTRVVGDGN